MIKLISWSARFFFITRIHVSFEIIIYLHRNFNTIVMLYINFNFGLILHFINPVIYAAKFFFELCKLLTCHFIRLISK